MEKPRIRAERRWRSFTKWMRRLRADWNDHGWRRDPVPMYEWKDGKSCIVGWKDSLCGCFDLRNKQALRFKDTPNGCNCSSCINPRRGYDGKNSQALTFAERREFLGDQEDWRKRKRRPGHHLFRILCRECGRQIGKVWVKNRESAFKKVRDMGWDRRCDSCRERRRKK